MKSFGSKEASFQVIAFGLTRFVKNLNSIKVRFPLCGQPIPTIGDL